MAKRRLIILLIILTGVFIACESKNEIDYQLDGPNQMAGNWWVSDFKGEYINIDSIHQISVEKPHNVLGPYQLVTALDPNNAQYLVIQNIWDEGLRVKAKIDSNRFKVKFGKQLDYFVDNPDDVAFISIDGYLLNEVDQLAIFIGVYDKYYQFLDTTMTYGARKTGWETNE